MTAEFRQFIDKAFWTVALALGVYISNEIRGMSNSIGMLNERVATLIERTSSQNNMLEDLQQRVKQLESRGAQ